MHVTKFYTSKGEEIPTGWIGIGAIHGSCDSGSELQGKSKSLINQGLQDPRRKRAGGQDFL